MLLFKRNWLVIVFVLISIILPLLWFRGDCLYSGEETNFINYQHILEKNNYSWSSGNNYGEPAAHWNHSLIIPNAVFYYGLAKLGVPNFITERIFLSLIILLILLSSQYLLKIFTKNPWLILLGSLFYLLNFYVANSFFYSAKMYQLILMPLFFVFMYRFLAEKKYIYLFYNFIILFIFQAIFTNLPQFLTTTVVFLLVVFYFALEKKIPIGKFFKQYWLRIILFLIPVLCIFLYHFLIFYFSVLQNTAELKNSITSFTAFTSSIFNILQLKGSWWEVQGDEGIVYNAWSTFYNNPVIIVVSFVILSPILIYIFKFWKENVAFRFWFICLIFFTLFASGFIIYPQIYEWLYNHVPFFYIFREPWAKFFPLVLFSLALLLVISLDKLRKNYLIILILILIVIRGGQFFSINFFDYSNIGWKKTFVEIPKYWQNYIAWTKNNQNSYMLPLPFFNNNANRFTYQWNQNNLGNAAFPIYSFYSANNSINTSLYFVPLSNYNRVVASLLSENNYGFVLLGPVDYLLDQKDINLDYKRTKNYYLEQEEVKKYFQENPFLSFDNKLLIYKIKPENYRPFISLSNKIILLDKPDTSLSSIVNSTYFDKDSVVFDANEENVLRNLEDIKIFAINSPDKETKNKDIRMALRDAYTEAEKWKNIEETQGGYLSTENKSSLTRALDDVNHAEKNYQKFLIANYPYIFDNPKDAYYDLEITLDIKLDDPIKDSYKININGNEYNAQSQKIQDKTYLKIENIFLPKREIKIQLPEGVIASATAAESKKNNSLPNLPATLNYEKINNTEYKISIADVSNPGEKILLNFNQDYHKSWSIFADKKTGFINNFFEKSLVNSQLHFISNGYANSWLLDLKTICSNNYCTKNSDGTYSFNLIIRYVPQKIFNILFGINILLVIIGLTYLIKESVTRKKF